MKPSSRQSIIHTNWETGIKPEFDGRQRVWEISVPFECVDLKSLKSGAEWPTITLNSGDIRNVFNPTVDKIKAMIREQVDAVVAKTQTDPKVDKV